MSKNVCIFVSRKQDKTIIIMVNVKNNAEMVNGMFNAANLNNETINVENGIITFYHRTFKECETKWLSFEAGSTNSFNEIVKIMHDAANGIDLFVDGVFVGYFKWSNNFENGYVGWKLFTDEGTKIAENECGMKRYTENSRNLVAASMFDYIKENFRDPVDTAVARWAEKNAERFETIKYNTDNGYFNVWIGSFFFQMDEKLTGDWDTDYRNAADYLENTLPYEIGGALETAEIDIDEVWDDALVMTENYLTLSDAWGLGFRVDDFLEKWAEYNIKHILAEPWRYMDEPRDFEIPVEMDGKSAKYDYPAADFENDVRIYLDGYVETAIKDDYYYASIIASYLYDVWNGDFSIFFEGRYHYDEWEGAIYDDEYKEPTDEDKERADEIADYCRDYGYNSAAAYLEDEDTDDDTVLLPVMGDCPDDFYDTFGEDADWDDDAMYLGMADYLNEGGKHHWRVECDGYRVYGYTIDDAA